jgi:mono/diheme cytochrome c family protein
MHYVTITRMSRAGALAALVAAALVASGCTNTGSEQSANTVAGKQLFVKKCGSCHTLRRAGTKGNVGPNLDSAFVNAREERQGDDAIRGVVLGQILYPGRNGVMPAKLVDGENANDIAAYVSQVAAKPGQDTGLLATAVKAAGGGKPIAAANGVLSIAADPGGQLAYASKLATATPGPIEIQMPNQSGIDHNLVVDGNGTKIETAVIKKGVAKANGTLAAGSYAFYCSVPGHRAGGMEGKLTVK